MSPKNWFVKFLFFILFLVSGSDDFTMFMWKPEKEKKSIARMTGHQQLVNDVKFRWDTVYFKKNLFFFYFSPFPVDNVKLPLNHSLIDWVTDWLVGCKLVGWLINWLVDWFCSPDLRLVASASFDKSIRIWCGKTGKYICVLRGHVQVKKKEKNIYFDF